MKNNKGFTLVELLAVITILALVALVSLEAIDSVNRGNKLKAEKVYAKGITATAIAYAPTAKYQDASGNNFEIRLPDIEYSFINSESKYYLNYFNSSSGIGRLLYWNKLPDAASAVGRRYAPVITCQEGGVRKEYFLGDGCSHVENKIEEVRISLDFLVREGLLDDNLKNPRNNKALDMQKSYVSIIMTSTTNFKVMGTTTGASFDYEFDTNLLCKYDGVYLYCLFQCYAGDTNCVYK